MKINLTCDWNEARACIFRSNIIHSNFAFQGGYLRKIRDLDCVDLNELLGLEVEIEKIKKNTQAFIEGRDASNVLVWGARGCGKSSIIKGVLIKFLSELSPRFRVIEIEKSDIWVLPHLMDEIREQDFRFVVYCDDLSFEAGDRDYKSLKSVLEGSLEKMPSNVVMYATSNRRHLIAEPQECREIHERDAYDEIISLSDRFGLSLGVYGLGSDEFLSIVRRLCADDDEFISLKQMALNYATLKGNQSGRSAKEFYKLYKNRIL